VGKALTYVAIAKRLGFPPKTVDIYRARAKQKLGLKHSLELRQAAFRWRDFARKRSSSEISLRIIQVRPSRNPQWKKQGGWEIFEAEGVCPAYCGEKGCQHAPSV
jgi:hypothetical protein